MARGDDTLHRGSSPDFIDFESVLPTGEVPALGLPITDQYAVGPSGVTFSVENAFGDTMFLGDYGNAREGWICGDLGTLDTLNAPEQGGSFFLAHPDQGLTELRDLLIDYTEPTAALSFDLADVDELEEWTITALDSTGSVLATTVLDANHPSAGDCELARVSFADLGGLIAQVRISFTGLPNPLIGFGFDNFSTSREEVLGGSVTGMTANVVICRNVTTGQTVTVPPSESSWNCEALGLTVSPGDVVITGARGTID